MRRIVSTKWLGIVGLLILFASGCGDAECGKGTKLVDGKCVSDSSLDCGEGTELVDGRCLVKCAEEEIRVNGACRPACDPEGSPFGGGEGTWTSPFRICTVEHLLEVRNHLGGDFVLTRNLDLSTLEDFEPLGGPGWKEGFRGRFDGGGFELRGLVIERPDGDDVGLFRRIEDGSAVRALGLVDFRVKGNIRVGTLAGSAEGILESIHATGVVTAEGRSVGGLVGTASASIVDSAFEGIVEGLGNSAGGLVGDGAGSIVGSYAKGTVKGGGKRVGGLVGDSSMNVENSYATTSVEGTEGVGGLVGYGSGIITNSYATGDATGTSAVGRLVGEGQVSIVNSYATGTVTGEADRGGLVGIHYEGLGPIRSSYFLDPEDGSEGEDAIGEPLTREALGKVESFPEWDFENTWEMTTLGAPDFPRPTLRALPEKP